MEKLDTEVNPNRRAVYAGSFDPPTNGHLWVIEQGALLFDELEVAVGVNPQKHTRFTIAERIEMLEAITEELPNVRIGQFENLFLVKYAHEQGFNYILRGLRSAKDFESENSLNVYNMDINKKIHGNVRSAYLICPVEYASISSSAVRDIVGPEGWEEVVADYVPAFVLTALIRHHERG